MNVGDLVITSADADIKPGNCKQLKDLPTGTIIHNVEVRPGKRWSASRGAGVGATLVAKSDLYCQVKMPSGEVRQILSTCYASVGQVGNSDHENIRVGKAGRSRWMGIRPSVRGMCQNPN